MEKKQIFTIRPCTWVYIFLMFFTFVTYLIGQMGFSGLEISLFVLFLALIKGHRVGSYFMGLGQRRGFWRWPVSIWLLIPGILISIAFLLGELIIGAGTGI